MVPFVTQQKLCFISKTEYSYHNLERYLCLFTRVVLKLVRSLSWSMTKTFRTECATATHFLTHPLTKIKINVAFWGCTLQFLRPGFPPIHPISNRIQNVWSVHKFCNIILENYSPPLPSFCNAFMLYKNIWRSCSTESLKKSLWDFWQIFLRLS